MNSKPLLELIEDHIESDRSWEQNTREDVTKYYRVGRIDALIMVKTWIQTLEEGEQQCKER